MKLKKKAQRIMCFLTVFILLFITAAPAYAAVEYPQGVTSEQAYQAIYKTDTLIDYLVKQTQNATLREVAEPMIYSDDVLNKILVGLYNVVEENADSLAVLGLRTSVSEVSSYLTEYGDVSSKLSAYTSWSEITDLGATWGVSEKVDFAYAISRMFTPFNELLYALLCSGNCSIGTGLFLNIKGSNGYETAIIPTLQALGCQSITSASDFYAHAQQDQSYMLYHIAYDVLTFIEGVFDAPCDRLTDVLPSIAYFTNNGGLENAVSTLISPLKVQLFGIATLANLETLISDSEEFTQNFAVNINDILSTLGFGLDNIDFDLIASCGTVSGNTVISDKPAVFIVVLRWIIDSIKLNETTLNEEVSGMNFMDVLDFSTAFSGIMDKSTDEIISILINLMTQSTGRYNDYYWEFAGFTQTSVPYTANLTAEKLQRVVEGGDELIDQLIAETDPSKTFNLIMQETIYSSKTLTSLISAIYGFFENEDMSAALQILDYDYSPRAISGYLYSSGFTTAASQLTNYSSWSQIDAEAFNWGFAAGNRAQFVACLCSALTPFEDILKMLLCEGHIQILGSIDIYGSNGYNTAVIPLLEAIGCNSAYIPTYEEFKSLTANGSVVKVLAEPICNLIDQITAAPVYTLTGILPNMVYFLDNGLVQCIENLIYPFEDLFEMLDMENSLGLGYIDESNISQMIVEMLTATELKLEGLTLKLPAIDLKSYSGMGTFVTAQSKRSYQGQYVNVSYVQADRNAVAMSLLRYVAQVIKTPGNEKILDSFTSSLEENTTVASFVQNITTQINIMTVDETVEWAYDVFFPERVTVEIAPEEEYVPEIVYEKKSSFKTVVIVLVIIYVILEVIYFFNRKKIRGAYEKFKENIKEKNIKKGKEV